MKKLEYLATMYELGQKYTNCMKEGNVKVISFELVMLGVPEEAFESLDSLILKDRSILKSGYEFGGPRGGYNYIFNKRLVHSQLIKCEQDAVSIIEYLENQELESWSYMEYPTFIRLETKVSGDFDSEENYVPDNTVILQRKNIELVFYRGEVSEK